MAVQTLTKTQDKKQRILDAARELMVRRGFQDLVMDDIAREADIAKGTLFLYFKSKEDLFAAAFADLVDKLGEELEEMRHSELKGEALVQETVRKILSHFDKYRDFTSNYAASGKFPHCGAHSNKTLMGKFKRNMELLGQVIRRVSRKASPVASFASYALFSLCRSAAMMKNTSDADYPLEARAREIVEFFFYGLRGI